MFARRFAVVIAAAAFVVAMSIPTASDAFQNCDAFLTTFYDDDVDANGALNFEEYTSRYRSIEFAVADVNANGEVSLTEFVNAFCVT